MERSFKGWVFLWKVRISRLVRSRFPIYMSHLKRSESITGKGVNPTLWLRIEFKNLLKVYVMMRLKQIKTERSNGKGWGKTLTPSFFY